ncbi:MAG: hypothetical protein V3T82_06070 [Nitrospinaceae bacterium]
MNTTSKSHFSKMCGISKAAVTKAVRAGLIIVDDAGAVNLDHRITRQYLSSKRSALGGGAAQLPGSKIPEKKPRAVKPKAPAKKKTAKVKPKAPQELTLDLGLSKPKAPVKKKAVKVKPKASPKKINLDDPLPPAKEFRTLADLTERDLRNFTKEDVNKLKTIEQTLKTRLDREAADGLLIERSLVKQVFARIHSIDTNELKTLKDRLTPAICGVFGEPDDSPHAVTIRKMLDDEMVKSLRHMKRLMDEFLTGIGAGAI